MTTLKLTTDEDAKGFHPIPANGMVIAVHEVAEKDFIVAAPVQDWVNEEYDAEGAIAIGEKHETTKVFVFSREALVLLQTQIDAILHPDSVSAQRIGADQLLKCHIELWDKA